jgi:nucleoside-diphosphate-sugar epimerase
VVVELLARGHEVHGIDSAPLHPDLVDLVAAGLRFTRLDLCDYGEAVEAVAGQDAVVHLAAIPAPGLSSPSHTLTLNTVTTQNVFLAATQAGLSRVVWASSETTLGLDFGDIPPRYFPVDEDHYPHPTTTYALSKVLGEVAAEHLASWSGIPFIGLRLSNVMPPDRYERDFPFDSDPASRMFNAFSYIDSRDAALAVTLALTAEVTGARSYVIASPDTVMETPTAELVERYFPGVPVRGELQGNCSLFSIERARRELGFEPRHSWRTSLPAGQPG